VDHWIVLSSSIEVRESSSQPWLQITDPSLNGKDIGDYQLHFEAYTWGYYASIGAKNSMSRVKIDNVDDFARYYYGFIAAV